MLNFLMHKCKTCFRSVGMVKTQYLKKNMAGGVQLPFMANNRDLLGGKMNDQHNTIRKIQYLFKDSPTEDFDYLTPPLSLICPISALSPKENAAFIVL